MEALHTSLLQSPWTWLSSAATDCSYDILHVWAFFYLHGMAMTMTDIPFTSFITGTPGVHVGAPPLVWWFPDSDSDNISTCLGLLDPVPLGVMPTDQSKSKAKKPLHKKLNPFIIHIYRHKIIQFWWHQSCILALSSYVHDSLNKSSQNIIP